MAHINSRRCADILVILTEIKKYVSSEVFMKRTIYLRFASKESTFWGEEVVAEIVGIDKKNWPHIDHCLS